MGNILKRSKELEKEGSFLDAPIAGDKSLRSLFQVSLLVRLRRNRGQTLPMGIQVLLQDVEDNWMTGGPPAE